MEDEEDINAKEKEEIDFSSIIACCLGPVRDSSAILHLPKNILDWTVEDVHQWWNINSDSSTPFLGRINGEMLLLLRERDLDRMYKDKEQYDPISVRVLHQNIRKLQLRNVNSIWQLNYDPTYIIEGLPKNYGEEKIKAVTLPSVKSQVLPQKTQGKREDGRATRLRPELWKTFISLVYLFVVTWITAFVMVIVHNRVPDMKKYPPLPDIFLDNVPHIPWAFAMCECTATLLLFIWIAVLLFHKHRFILMRRFFALSGTVFLLRCVTMLITSLSVPGTHLQCVPMAEEVQLKESVWTQMQQAYVIWSGAGLSIKGVRTCGDYMFSGHTAALTILNFFITEYTPRHLYFMHTFSWVLNMFGIFFILSAHEHYSIDVFIAFYITSRLFLYYHTLANNQALMQRDSTRTRIWFPLFSFFESEIDGIIPNEFDTPSSLTNGLSNAFQSLITFFYTISMRRTFVRRKKD